MKIPTKFPTIVGLFLCVLVVGSVIFVVENAFRAPSQASGSQEPKDVRITNVTDAAFTVTWTTQLPSTGTILVSNQKTNNEIHFDDRDTIEKKLRPYVTHSVTVRNMPPDSDNTIAILSNGQKYLNVDKPYTVHTATTLSPPVGGLAPAYGTIKTSDDQGASDALVYLTLQDGQTLSTLTKSSGLWLIPLSLVRTQDLTTFLPIVDRMTVNILIVSTETQTTAITDTLNDSPVPDMVIGKTYDFRKLQAKTTGNDALALRPVTPTPAQLAQAIGGAVLGQTTSRTFTVAFTTPAQDAAIASTLPFVQGTGIPDKYVGILLGITSPTSASTKVGADGVWNYTPTKPLGTGKQSITISTVNAAGKPIALTHTFQILKSGTQVLGDATPSATPVASVTATPIEVPTSTLAGQPVPTTGNELPTILILLVGFAFLASGAVVTLR